MLLATIATAQQKDTATNLPLLSLAWPLGWVPMDTLLEGHSFYQTWMYPLRQGWCHTELPPSGSVLLVGRFCWLKGIGFWWPYFLRVEVFWIFGSWTCRTCRNCSDRVQGLKGFVHCFWGGVLFITFRPKMMVSSSRFVVMFKHDMKPRKPYTPEISCRYPKWPYLKRRYMFQSIILGIHVRFLGV